MSIKKLAILSTVPLFLVTFTSVAATYTVNFTNPTSNTYTTQVTANNKSTYIECSGNCTSLPPNGNVIYKISTSGPNLPPWGNFTTTFTYSKDSLYCLSAIESMIVQYEQIANYYMPDTNFYINIGDTLPIGLYGSVKITKKCAT